MDKTVFEFKLVIVLVFIFISIQLQAFMSMANSVNIIIVLYRYYYKITTNCSLQNNWLDGIQILLIFGMLVKYSQEFQQQNLKYFMASVNFQLTNLD